ncbi:MAG TPA: Ig-like domain-containing protein [Terriglobales bacterium]|nr:Ig-like domain-containing protein [Terriglobales bacterium]
MLRECRWILVAALGLGLTGCGSNSSSSSSSTSTKVVGLAISPQSPTIALGSSQQFTATETLADGTANDVTSTVTWASSAPKIATISTGGMVSSLTQGTTHISATLGSNKASTLLTINPAALVSMTLTPASAKIAKYTDQQFTAMGSFTNGSTQNVSSLVTWSSSAPTIASVSKSGLAVAGSAPGSTVISASLDNISASSNLTVTNVALDSIAVTPADSTIPEGVFRQFVATGTFSDGSTQNISLVTTWSSTGITVAGVSATGLLSALGVGTSTISATLNSTTGSTEVTVATPVLISVAIQPSNGKVAISTGLQLTAIGTYNNGSTKNLTSQVTWGPSSSSIVTVNSSGFASALSLGSATITAALGSITTSTNLTVTDATLVSMVVTPTSPTIAVGGSRQFTATGSFSDGSTEDMSAVPKTTWTSSDTAVATMSGATATGVSGGTATIKAAFGSVGGSANLTVNTGSLTSLSISPTSATITEDGTQQFTVTGHYSNGTTLTLNSSATWSTSDPSVAAISDTGLANGLQGGSTSITASFESFTATADLKVTGAALSSIAVSPATASIAPETTEQFTATGIYADQNTRNLSAFVVWTSSDLSVATVSDSSPSLGLATAVASGNTLVGAVLSKVLGGSASLTVSNATLVSITVTPATPSLLLGQSFPFTATGTFSDNTTQVINGSVTWTSSAPTVATIGASGVAASASVGTTTITATMNSISGSTTLTVVQ